MIYRFYRPEIERAIPPLRSYKVLPASMQQHLEARTVSVIPVESVTILSCFNERRRSILIMLNFLLAFYALMLSLGYHILAFSVKSTPFVIQVI